MPQRDRGGPRFAAAAAWAIAWVLGCGVALAQQPFVVDDAEVAAKGVPHLEVSTQVDALKRSAHPAIWQNVFETEVALGLPGRLETGFLLPFISLVSDAGGGRRAVHGPGDSSLAVKWRLTRDPAARVSWAGSASLELPTGSARRGLGSALVDYGVNVVSQVVLTPAWTLRGNLGGILAGNLQTGAVGITARGGVMTAGASLVRALDRGQFGGELTAAWSPNVALTGSSLGAQVGGNLRLSARTTLDGGLALGWFAGSPAWSMQLGFSADLR